MSFLISGRNVVKKFGDLIAVDNVDFDVGHGELFGFLGPNGAGKTSVMKMIQCLSPMSGGQITVAGMSVGVDDRDIKSMLGVAPQDNSLDPDLTVIKNLEVYARYFGISRKLSRSRAEELLDFFHLADKRDTKIRALSGGMQRGLVIARALINEPRVLILDEPTTGLDPHARRAIWQKLKSLKQEGVTMLLTTHYMEEADALCDRVAVMDRGKIIVAGKPDELIKSKVGAYAATIPTDETNTAQLIKALDDQAISYELVENRVYAFTDDPEMLTKSLPGAGYKISIRPANLEDLFFTLTGKRKLDGEATG